MKMKLKRLLVFALIFMLIFMSSINCTVLTQAASDVTVNLASEKQVIRGFGGMNYPDWQGSDLTAAQRQTAFGNGEKELGFSILRIHVDPDKRNWSKELDTAKAAIKNGAIVFASPWHPPVSTAVTVNGQKRVDPNKYAEYAQHLNDFVAYMKENGVDLYAISIQNEPDYAKEWTAWSAQEIVTFLKGYAGKINCRIIAPESFQYVKTMSDSILNDSAALSNMDILGAHLYGQFPYPLFKQKGAGKDLWMTEVYVPNSETNSADRWPESLDVAVHMHNSMVEAEFQAYVWWFIRRHYGPMKEDGTMSMRGAMMAHFSKYVRPGYVRVDATKSPATNVYVSAYKGGGKVAVVAINKGTSAVSQKFSIQGATPTKVSSYITTSSSKLAAGAAISVSGSSYTAQLPAQSVTTFVCDIGIVVPTQTVSPTTTISPTPTFSSNVILGDVDGDGAVNSIDFGYYRKYLLGTINDFPVEDDLKAADLDGNGNIDSIDFGHFRKYLLGLISKFPAA
jgi:glucuronoarabinoxylan endo-1,4-beta-xylanase